MSAFFTAVRRGDGWDYSYVAGNIMNSVAFSGIPPERVDILAQVPTHRVGDWTSIHYGEETKPLAIWMRRRYDLSTLQSIECRVGTDSAIAISEATGCQLALTVGLYTRKDDGGMLVPCTAFVSDDDGVIATVKGTMVTMGFEPVPISVVPLHRVTIDSIDLECAS